MFIVGQVVQMTNDPLYFYSMLSMSIKKSEDLYSPLHGTNHSKALRITQLLTCKEHHASLYLVSVHQMAPPLNVVANI